MLYSCSFVSVNAIERPKIKALPLFLLLGAIQVFDVIGKPLVQNISNMSTTVATNVANTTTNIISEIVKKFAALEQKENILGLQINKIDKNIDTLYDNGDFYYQEQVKMHSDISSIKSGMSIAIVILAVCVVCLCSSSHAHKSSK
jgi:hypothetical protein